MLVEVTTSILHCPYFAKLIQYGQMFRLQCDCWLNYECYDDVYLRCQYCINGITTDDV